MIAPGTRSHISNAGTPTGNAGPDDEAPAGNPKFSDFVDAQEGGPDESDEPTDPRSRFTDWIGDSPIDTTYRDHTGPRTDPRSRGGR